MPAALRNGYPWLFNYAEHQDHGSASGRNQDLLAQRRQDAEYMGQQSSFKPSVFAKFLTPRISALHGHSQSCYPRVPSRVPRVSFFLTDHHPTEGRPHDLRR